MFSILLGSKEFSKQYTYLVTHTVYLSCGRWFSVIDLSHEKKMQKKEEKIVWGGIRCQNDNEVFLRDW